VPASSAAGDPMRALDPMRAVDRVGS
jgi:hypothetical protein